MSLGLTFRLWFPHFVTLRIVNSLPPKMERRGCLFWLRNDDFNERDARISRYVRCCLTMAPNFGSLSSCHGASDSGTESFSGVGDQGLIASRYPCSKCKQQLK
ncbi:hypothetical protein AVEN_129126-1 [Araneus ventricosus]|uniref:Uncharacterized protein n=1 Tax=Araneus ventricosus TaxID=182803 RepID=A0A4Y2RYC7_ARAVE|nr:hypothetical protein AVEN_129126-1 [Araneus ventricosus]